MTLRYAYKEWQSLSASWQSAFIRENYLLLGHRAWQGYLTKGRGMLVCTIEVSDAKAMDWCGDAVQYKVQYLRADAVSPYLQSIFHLLGGDVFNSLMDTVQSYAPEREILILISNKGAIEIAWLQNLAIAPPECHRQVCNRWTEFAFS